MSTSTRELVNPPALHPAPGFSHICIAPPGRVAYIAGQTALAPDFSVIGGDDLGEQTRAAMENVRLALEAVGAGWHDVVRRTIYTLRPTEYEVITAAVEDVQGSDQHPAQTIVGVTGLAVEGLLIEIEVTVHLP
ncbi:RidA family protein [Georgenia thermotolerans]|uniref:RidA family protein n=1 Tax=Georgenia thermotolerans TaxID=527326 RepID=A0A7J5UUZ5_9MICO|nr:RidA family protein [Georgenia thermotolerans]KAE8766114.1 RidA family protein [Georgenia thermotolerans]